MVHSVDALATWQTCGRWVLFRFANYKRYLRNAWTDFDANRHIKKL